MKLFGPDFYNITELLTEEELMIQRTAYEFVQAEFMPLVHEHYEKGISCHKCFGTKTDKKISSLRERKKQIKLLKDRRSKNE